MMSAGSVPSGVFREFEMAEATDRELIVQLQEQSIDAARLGRPAALLLAPVGPNEATASSGLARALQGDQPAVLRQAQFLKEAQADAELMLRQAALLQEQSAAMKAAVSQLHSEALGAFLRIERQAEKDLQQCAIEVEEKAAHVEHLLRLSHLHLEESDFMATNAAQLEASLDAERQITSEVAALLLAEKTKLNQLREEQRKTRLGRILAQEISSRLADLEESEEGELPEPSSEPQLALSRGASQPPPRGSLEISCDSLSTADSTSFATSSMASEERREIVTPRKAVRFTLGGTVVGSAVTPPPLPPPALPIAAPIFEAPDMGALLQGLQAAERSRRSIYESAESLLFTHLEDQFRLGAEFLLSKVVLRTETSLLQGQVSQLLLERKRLAQTRQRHDGQKQKVFHEQQRLLKEEEELRQAEARLAERRQALQHSEAEIREQHHALSSELLLVQAEWAAQREQIDSELAHHKQALSSALLAAADERAALQEARAQVLEQQHILELERQRVEQAREEAVAQFQLYLQLREQAAVEKQNWAEACLSDE
eukprot:RCo033756